MIQIQHLFHSYAEKVLYKDASTSFKPSRKVALIGNNGTGKTTLFRLLTGEEETQKGTVLVPKAARVEYLAQELKTDSRESILGECLSAFEDAFALERKLSELHSALQARPEDGQLLSTIEKTQHELAGHDVYRLESDAKKVLAGLGFKAEEFEKSIQEFSGGWQMRVHLAKMLLRKPDYLLLDEPTNHLDIESLSWLESYLRSYENAVIIISHDRTFLDEIVDEVIELHQAKFERYAGNYTEFESQKEERILREAKAAGQLEHQVRHIQTFVDRFRYKATKAKQVQSRIKMLEKLDDVSITENSKHIAFSFAVSKRSAKRVFEYDSLAKNYGEKRVLEDLGGTIYRGEKIALMGANGQGKSTFVKLLTREISPTAGTLSRGESVDVGYYSQHQLDQLDANKTLYEEVLAVATPERRPAIRSVLGAFLFHGEDVDKKIAVLSGGEKARVALAKLLVQPVNVLILDEPTNHLDLQSKERLQLALSDFDGTIIVISHDRSFLDGLVEKVYYFSDGNYTEFTGELSELSAWREAHMRLLAAADAKPAAKASYAELKKLKNQIAKTQREIAALEAELERIDSERDEITGLMNSGESDVAKLMEWQAALDSLAEKEGETYAAWEEKEAELNELEQDLN